jgi:hypothetical protein
VQLLDEFNRGEKTVSTKSFSCSWRDLLSPTVAQDAAVVGAATAEDTIEEGAGAAAARAAAWAEAAGGSVEGGEMDAAADASAGEAMADVGLDAPAGDSAGASTWASETEWGEAPQDGLTEAVASTETGAAAGAEAEVAMVDAQLPGAGDETTLPPSDEPDSADAADTTAIDVLPETFDALSQAEAAACAEASESCDLYGTLSAADALGLAEAALNELFGRYNTCDAPAPLRALQLALSKRRDGALILSGATGVGELHAAPASASPSAPQLSALGVRPALCDVTNRADDDIPRSKRRRAGHY